MLYPSSLREFLRDGSKPIIDLQNFVNKLNGFCTTEKLCPTESDDWDTDSDVQIPPAFQEEEPENLGNKNRYLTPSSNSEPTLDMEDDGVLSYCKSPRQRGQKLDGSSS